MKRVAVLVALAMLGLRPGYAAEGDGLDAETALLTAFDERLTPSLITDVMGAASAARLLELVADAGADPGVRLRALRALGGFPEPAARAALRGELDALLDDTDGAQVVQRMAAVEALGLIGDGTDVPRLVVMLELEASRDLREVAARALASLGDPAAIQPLRERLLREPTDQVAIAIADALRLLDE